jgi:3'-phosphoadenosine 5'-phosphosulfate synthase
MSGKICITAFISPYEKDREFAKQIHNDEGLKFYEGFISASLEVCEKRDPKGMYKLAREGKIKNFTGVSDPYEEPSNPDIDIQTGEKTIQQCVTDCLNFLSNQGVISSNSATEFNVKELYDFDEELAKEAQELEFITIDDERIEFLHVLADGWAGKLKCFMTELQLLETLHYKTITCDDGEKYLHSVPITCHVTLEDMEKCKDKEKISLKHAKTGEILAVIECPVFYPNRKEEISSRLFGTMSKKHPRVERIFEEGEFLLTGSKLKVLTKIKYNDGLDDYRLSPNQIKKLAEQKGADAIYGFQLRNPLHSGHVMLLNSTRDKLIERGYSNPILLLHPCGGWTKDDDVPLNTRIEQHQALIQDGELLDSQTILAVWPSPMFYAGPSEVLWHVSSRLNAGVQYFIVGRDPAGIGHPELKGENLYDPFHGQQVLDLGKHLFHRTVEIMPFKVAAYNKGNIFD